MGWGQWLWGGVDEAFSGGPSQLPFEELLLQFRVDLIYGRDVLWKRLFFGGP